MFRSEHCLPKSRNLYSNTATQFYEHKIWFHSDTMLTGFVIEQKYFVLSFHMSKHDLIWHSSRMFCYRAEILNLSFHMSKYDFIWHESNKFCYWGEILCLSFHMSKHDFIRHYSKRLCYWAEIFCLSFHTSNYDFILIWL